MARSTENGYGGYLSTFARALAAVLAVATTTGFLAFGAAAVAETASEETGEGASSEKEADVNRVALAGTLIRDGHYGRARRELSKVDPTSSETDQSLYYTLRGLVALHKDRNRRAIEHFNHAIRHGQTDERVFVHLAQAYYGLQRWREVVRSVRNAGDTGRELADLQLMKAQAQMKLGRSSGAWETLASGRETFPERDEFLRQQVFLLVQLGLYRAALERGRRYLRETEDVAAEDYLAVARAFRRAGQHRRAQVLLESARARYPEHLDVLVHLAHAYVGTDDHVAAGELMQIAAERKPKYMRKAAELYRRGGALNRAVYMNGRVPDQRAKFKQRAAILLDQKKFERIAAMDARLSRLGLLEDAKIRYTSAYAHFKTGEYERAAELTRGIESKKLYKSAVELRRAIQKCQREPWKC